MFHTFINLNLQKKTSDVITVGNLTSFILYAAYVGIGFSGVSTFYAETMKALGASSRIWEITDKVPAIPVEGGLVPDKPLKGEIEFQSVAFGYPSRPDVKVLDGLSLKVPSDRVTGLATISISFSLKKGKKIISTMTSHWDRMSISFFPLSNSASTLCRTLKGLF